ncbi:MAG: UDP-N-acetylmuramoyl-L-alanyl-D-glutamate--2,6-diaminopimelate ligase [Oscillospiraceae bacterium]|nr:UDP-N-acetylmuramoyl-L-alanyl-D-glutamate--2,6-diaminopimelate ligase [Oscillospiraceae bacterium]
MLLKDLLQSIPVLECTAPEELEISSVCYDSRKAGPGSLFVAIPGFASDGHKFIPSALDQGAAAVLCERPPEGKAPYILVANARAALAQLGANWFGHPTKELPVIGITGTNGKTTVTYLLKSILEQVTGAKIGLIGTIQNMIGDQVLETERTTPESFELQGLFRQMADAGCRYAVMEVSSHALCLNRVDCVDFCLGVFTNLTEDHLDFHKTMEAYGQAKAQLFARCPVSVLNMDDPAWTVMKASACGKVLTYSMEDDRADLVAKNVRLKSDRVEMEAVIGNEIRRLELGIPGAFSVYNALAAVLAALGLGLSLKDVAAALKNARGVKGRVEVVPTPGQPYTMLIDYAHTPDGLENVLRTVRGFAKGRTVVLFGCGGDRDPIKRPIMGKIAADLADFVVVTSDNPRTEEPGAIIQQILAGMEGTKTPYTVIENRREAIAWVMDHAMPDDVIVLAGKGHETYQILGHEKTHLDEREEVAAHLEQMKKEQTT